MSVRNIIALAGTTDAESPALAHELTAVDVDSWLDGYPPGAPLSHASISSA
jgi:hypothetical protein